MAAQNDLQGKRIAVLMTDGVEQVEYTRPRQFLEEHGAQVTLLAPKSQGESIQGFNHLSPADQFQVEMSVGDAKADAFDALVLPGGVANPDTNPDAVRFIQAFSRARKPVAAICHGPWSLIEAGLVRGKRMTSWPSLRTDLRNAGAEWVDEEVVVDVKLITSRKPDDIPAFNRAVLGALAG